MSLNVADLSFDALSGIGEPQKSITAGLGLNANQPVKLCCCCSWPPPCIDPD